MYIDGSKFEANANKYSWVWKKSCIKNRDKTFEKVSEIIDIINVEDLELMNIKIEKSSEYTIEYLEQILEKYRNNPYKSTNFKYDKSGNLICPNGRKLNFKFNRHIYGNKYGRTEEIYECESCQNCPHKQECCPKTKNNGTVRINKELTSMHEEVLKNLCSIHGALLCMNRSIQAEGTYGIIKNDKSYKRIKRRGLDNVILELTLISCGFNLCKYHNKKARAKQCA